MHRIAIILIAIMLCGCDVTDIFSADVSSAIGKAIRNNGTNEIDLAQIVPFQWDELYLFTPYAPVSQICKELGIPEQECSSAITDESHDDGEMYMVFRLNGKIVHKEMHSRINGDFTPINYPVPIKIEQSKFKVINTGEQSVGGKPWLRLMPVKDS